MAETVISKVKSLPAGRAGKKVKSSESKVTASTVSKTNNSLGTPFNGNILNTVSEKIVNFKPNKNFYFLLIIIGIALILMYKKQLIIAAMVNGQPISNFQLQMRLNQQFRTQTINQLVNEKIITDEAIKNKALPTDAEINTKIAEIEKSVGGTETFNSLLLQQGQDRNSIKSQIKLELAIEKLYGNEASVSAQEVEEFITNNSSYLRASDSAGQSKEAETAIKQQKMSQIFSQKFQELKQKAKIQIF